LAHGKTRVESIKPTDGISALNQGAGTLIIHMYSPKIT